VASLFRTKPWVNREMVAGIEMQKRYSSDKARRELGFFPLGLRETVQQTFDWYKQQALL